jgi:hypothetical protein
MPQPPSTHDDPQQQRSRTRGAIRTHLGRKRLGGRGRRLGEETLEGVRELGAMRRSEQERAFERLRGQFQAHFDASADKSAAAFDLALDKACEALVTASEFTADTTERLRQFLRRDLLQKDHPMMTFRSGDITSAGTLGCEGCGWTIIAAHSTLLPACPQCGDTSFRKSS